MSNRLWTGGADGVNVHVFTIRYIGYFSITPQKLKGFAMDEFDIKKEIHLIVDELVLAIDGLFLSVCKISEMTTQFLDLTLLNKIKRENETLIDKVFDVKASVEQKKQNEQKGNRLKGGGYQC
ncbi:hypothetical protein [Aeromonas veronii]|uniref:hypothetical protein n=1 Tax=Aeromonas veronii TaxID=654 RepID=UPI002443CED4|nr:hypothetical protein [Aeromonas veronii]